MKTSSHFIARRWFSRLALACAIGFAGQNLLANDYDAYLVARYDFENTNSPYADSSGHNNNPNEFGAGSQPDIASTNAAVGQYARLFFGDTDFAFDQSDPAYPVLSNALTGDFSVTAWVSTTNTVGNDYQDAYYGAAVFYSASDYINHCAIPLTITSNLAAFEIVSSDGPGTVTVKSTTSVTDGNYHFLAVTRQQSTGLMSIYVDGSLEATTNGITDTVITQGYINIAGGPYNYSGLLDDVRLYSTNLSASDVLDIYSSNGLLTLAKAIGATNLGATTSGDTDWFVEATNTYNGEPYAAQSGVVTNEQTSTLSVTVTGPGELTFYWACQGSGNNFYYTCYLDGDPYGGYLDEIYGLQSWYQAGEDSTNGSYFAIPSGEHTVSWTLFAYGDDDPTEAGFLDNVSYVPTVFTPPPPPTGNWTATGSIGTRECFAFPLTVLPNGDVLASGGQAVFEIFTYYESDLYVPSLGHWVTTGFMNDARQSHTTTLLTNGLVLAAGGVVAGSEAQTLSACELYYPSTGSWSNTGSMSQARYSHTAVLLTNGLVLVAGGMSNATTLASAELYNPATGTWSVTSNMNTARASASAFLLTNGTVLVVGGQGTNNITLSNAEIYNPGTGLWRYTASPMLAAHYEPICQLLTNGQVLVAGGSTNGGSSETGFSELYDPANDSWNQTGSMNVPRESAGSVVLANGVVLAAGGGSSNYKTNAELYAPNSGLWTETGAMLEGRGGSFPMVLLASGQALATGGFPANNDMSEGTTELYTTTMPTITITNPMKLANGSFQFSFTYTPGAGSTVFATTNLALPLASWTTLGSATEVSPGQYQFTDTQAPTNSTRYYRVRSP